MAESKAVRGSRPPEMPVITAVRDDGTFQAGRPVPDLEHPRAAAPLLEERRVPAAHQLGWAGCLVPAASGGPERDDSRSPVADVPISAGQRVPFDERVDGRVVVGDLERKAVAEHADSGNGLAPIAVAKLR